MSRIVLGIGTSHSPLLAIPPALWAARGRDDEKRQTIFLADGRVVSYPELLAEQAGRFAPFATPAVFERQSSEAQRTLDRLADELARERPDLIVIIGDDQEELFSTSHTPAVAIYTGAEIVTYPKNELSDTLPEWYRTANAGYLMDRAHRHPAAPEVAMALIDAMIARGVDLGLAGQVHDPRQRGFGHAFGFVIHRLMRGAATPVLPLMINTYFPPNVPRPGRCWDIGVALGEAIAELPGDLRVCVVASGGLTHFATDAGFDRRVLQALAESDEPWLRAIDPAALRSGNSEILNWIAAAGALRDLAAAAPDYLPVYRTPAGTGIGLGFMAWRPR